MNKKWSRVWLAAFIVFAAALAGWSIFSELQKTRYKKKLNILVVSACSLRRDRVGVFNPESKLTPKIDAWAKGSFVFTNGIVERPWQNYVFESTEFIRRKFLEKHGYKSFMDRPFGYIFYVPENEKAEADEKVWFWPEDAILKYEPDIAELKAELQKDLDVPFYIFTHLKYMHYPYLDTVNMGEPDWKKLSPRSQALLRKYRANPEAFDAQLPMIEVITNSFSLLKKKFGLKSDVYSVAGIVSDPDRNAKWRATPGFADDLQLVQELYDLKMAHFDGMAAEILNLFGIKELQDNTVVIFTGDHGEAFSEHGVIGHSVNVYDEMLRIPLIVKFPGAEAPQPIDAQLTLAQITNLAKAILLGTVNAQNFAAEARALSLETVLSRNCADTIHSARHKGEWKFIKNLVAGKNELYNLVSDPAETKNLIDENPEMAWKLEEYMGDHLDVLKRENKRGAKSKVCVAN